VRGGEAAMGNLVADALRASVGADVAITNGGGLRADKQYEAGQKLTRRNILAEMPFGNTTVLLEVTGAQIKAALENGVSQVRELGGRFPQVSGIVAEVDVKEPVGSRVKSVKINGQPLDPANTYKLATNDFMARGGDGYRVFTEAKSLVDVSASQLMATQVIDYIAKAGKVAPKVEGRVVLR
jgi:5'-nucleotidase / UDP-sugar diphosphatase